MCKKDNKCLYNAFIIPPCASTPLLRMGLGDVSGCLMSHKKCLLKGGGGAGVYEDRDEHLVAWKRSAFHRFLRVSWNSQSVNRQQPPIPVDAESPTPLPSSSTGPGPCSGEPRPAATPPQPSNPMPDHPPISSVPFQRAVPPPVRGPDCRSEGPTADPSGRPRTLFPDPGIDPGGGG